MICFRNHVTISNEWKVMIPIPNKERCLLMHAVFCARCSTHLYKQIEMYECDHTVADMQKHATMAENEYGIKAMPTYKIMDRNSISNSATYLRTKMIMPYHMSETIRGIRGAFSNETLTEHGTYGPLDDFVMIGMFTPYVIPTQRMDTITRTVLYCLGCDDNIIFGSIYSQAPTTSYVGDRDTAPNAAYGLYAHMQKNRNANQNLAENITTKRNPSCLESNTVVACITCEKTIMITKRVKIPPKTTYWFRTLYCIACMNKYNIKPEMIRTKLMPIRVNATVSRPSYSNIMEMTSYTPRIWGDGGHFIEPTDMTGFMIANCFDYKTWLVTKDMKVHANEYSYTDYFKT
ncbi:hypothetical protein PG989_001252 [Apiospora arundinis]